MRPILLFSTATAVALSIAIPIGVSASGADVGPGESSLDRAVVAGPHELEPIRLECEVRSADAGPVVACTWSEPMSARAAAVELFRFDPAVDPHRKVIYRSGNLAATSFTDPEVRPGHRYVYALQVYDALGRAVGRSRAEWVRVPPAGDQDVEMLRLACRLADSGQSIGCEWSAPTSRDAAVVSLWRSVDGNERELVERFGPQGPTAYRDIVPDGASHVTYAVIATSDSDRIVGRSRPVTVRIRRNDTGPVDARPVDTQPVDSQPVDSQPVDSQPVDSQPVDSQPVDPQPVDTQPVDTQPVDTQPVDSQPVDTQPVDTQPVDTQPVDTQPVDIRSADTRASAIRTRIVRSTGIAEP